MKILIAVLLSLSFAYAQVSVVSQPSADISYQDNAPKNAISIGRNHSTLGVTYSRNYYPYAAASIFLGAHQKEEDGLTSELQALGLSLDWTAENSTNESGLYLRPGIVFYKVNSENNGLNKGSYQIGSTRLYDGDTSLAISVTPYLKLVGNVFDNPMSLNAGIEFLHLRSENVARFMLMGGVSF